MPYKKGGANTFKNRKKHAIWLDQQLDKRISQEKTGVSSYKLSAEELKALNTSLKTNRYKK